MSRPRKIAAGLAVRVMMESPFMGKSAGTRESLEAAFLPGAKLIAKAEQRIKSNAERIAAEDQRWNAAATGSNGHKDNSRFQEMVIPSWNPGLN